MPRLDLTDTEHAAVRRALTAITEAHEMEAHQRLRTRGYDRHVQDLQNEAATLRGVLERNEA